VQYSLYMVGLTGTAQAYTAKQLAGNQIAYLNMRARIS